MSDEDEFKNLTPEEKLHAENEVLKLKLQAEFGMSNAATLLGKEAENDWLNHIYNFEKQFSEHKLCKLFDFIGKPEFKIADGLSETEISEELAKIIEVMQSKGINLDTICEYDEEVIYRFITEELFEKEIDDIRIVGMTHNFIYEEFHPNHDYDIRKNVDDFVEFLLKKKWSEYNEIILYTKIEYNKKSYDKSKFIEIIHAFQNENSRIKILNLTISTIDLLLDHVKQTGSCTVTGYIKYETNNSASKFEGEVILELKLEYDFWSISKVSLPGFSQH